MVFLIVDIRRAPSLKHLRSRKRLENEKQYEMIIPERLFKEPIENKIKKVYKPKTLKQTAIENIKLEDKQFKKEIQKKIINPKYFTDRV